MSLLDNDAEDLSFEAVFEALLDGRDGDTHKALVGVVERYVSDEQVADIRPVIRRVVPTTDGGTVSESHPIVRAVPLIWPRVGTFFIHMPLAAGDAVLMICTDRDISRWRQTGDDSDPVDRRLHHIAHAVAIPGIISRSKALAAGDVPGDALVIGKVGGATIRIAMDESITLATTGDVLLGAGASKGVGRVGDSVDVTVPSLTFGVAFVAPSTLTLNPGPVTLSGMIVAGSAKVKAVD